MKNTATLLTRTLDWGFVIVFSIFWLLLATNLLSYFLSHYQSFTALSFFIMIIIMLLGYVTADFFSGMIHFLADNWGKESTPLWGRVVVQPFREHHLDPLLILEHNFVELNGNSAGLCLPVLILYYFFGSLESMGNFFFIIFLLAMCVSLLLTNSIHRLAHHNNPSKRIIFLQKYRFILPQDHHAKHHKFPHHCNFCTTTGWLNPLLNRFFLMLILRIQNKKT